MSEYELYLAHHGVKGMKWGVRKKEPYRQDLGGGVSAVWPSKKAFKKAEKARVKREKAEFKTDLNDYRKASNDLSKAVKALAPGRENNSQESRQTAINALTKLSYVKANISTKKGEDYLKRVMDKSDSIERNRTIAFIGGLVGASVGLAYVQAKYGWD